MTEHMPQNPAPIAASRPRRLNRLAAIVGAGLLAGVLAATAGGVASAQAVVEIEPNDVQVRTAARAQVQDEDVEPSVEADTSFERFEACLEAGIVELEDLDGEAALDESAVEDVFEECESILDERGQDFRGDPDFRFDFDLDRGHFDLDFGDGFALNVDLGLSPADAAIVERYEGCLEDAGVTFDGWFDDFDETDFDAAEEAFEACEPILDELSEDVFGFSHFCPDDDD